MLQNYSIIYKIALCYCFCYCHCHCYCYCYCYCLKVEPLKVESVANILISADFLQIDDLVDECLKFIHLNVNEVNAFSSSL